MYVIMKQIFNLKLLKFEKVEKKLKRKVKSERFIVTISQLAQCLLLC
jgi:hypothetical protein